MTTTRKTVKISKRTVDAIKPNGTDFYVFDADLAGFGVRIRATGAMSYIVQYRAGSGRAAPDRRITIAKVGKITRDQARDRAGFTRGCRKRERSGEGARSGTRSLYLCEGRRAVP